MLEVSNVLYIILYHDHLAQGWIPRSEHFHLNSIKFSEIKPIIIEYNKHQLSHILSNYFEISWYKRDISSCSLINFEISKIKKLQFTCTFVLIASLHQILSAITLLCVSVCFWVHSILSKIYILISIPFRGSICLGYEFCFFFLFVRYIYIQKFVWCNASSEWYRKNNVKIVNAWEILRKQNET